MSKSVARVILVALVGVALVAAAYLTVQGAFAKAESASVQAHVVGGLQTNFNHDRSSAAEVQTVLFEASSQDFKDSGQGHGCESEARVNPDDY